MSRELTDAQKTAIRIQAAQEMVPRGRDHESSVNLIRALNVAHDERIEAELIPMPLTDAVRDKLIFNGRQDAAHAVLNSISPLRAQRRTNQLLGVLIALVVVLIAVVAAGLLRR